MSEHLFVVTGGPGSGKSSLITELKQRGINTMTEGGRAIIRDQVKIGGHALPWVDSRAFAEQMLSWELRSYHEAKSMAGPVVMDRGIVDVVGYLTLCALSVPAHFEKAARLFCYNKRVFLAPYWEGIYTQDAERKQDLQEAEASFEAMTKAYIQFGYEIIELPLLGVEARADFVLQHLKS